jgi:hypothetical protein
MYDPHLCQGVQIFSGKSNRLAASFVESPKGSSCFEVASSKLDDGMSKAEGQSKSRQRLLVHRSSEQLTKVLLTRTVLDESLHLGVNRLGKELYPPFPVRGANNVFVT